MEYFENGRCFFFASYKVKEIMSSSIPLLEGNLKHFTDQLVEGNLKHFTDQLVEGNLKHFTDQWAPFHFFT
jgi:hypothetical protein